MNKSQSNVKVKAAIIGSGNIGTDLMIKIQTLSACIELSVLVGIDASSDGLAKARAMGVATTADGIQGLLAMPEFAQVQLVFDATSAGAHQKHAAILKNHNVQVIDLTPAAIGPYVVPSVNLEAFKQAKNVNMVTCGGQATIPIVAAINAVADVAYGEIVASIASRSAGPGTRANIDEFTQTTSKAIEQVGGASIGKAIIVLNPAEPPLIMRDTVHCLCAAVEPSLIEQAVAARVQEVQSYVPGYRLKQAVQIEPVSNLHNPVFKQTFSGLKVSVLLEVEGAGHYLPRYAGNLDIMTSAALRTAEFMMSQTEVA